MKILVYKETPLRIDVLADRIQQAFADTRFKLGEIKVEGRIGRKYKGTIDLGSIRLQSSKQYCGNHPSACERFHPAGHKEPKRRYLEGADWVELNDRLNDVLDELNVAADVGTFVVIRKGYSRCTSYHEKPSNFPGQNAQWEKEGVYENYCGKEAPRADFPEGTPGVHEQISYNVVG